MKSYGQHCPVARGAELFAERWTPIIVRNLLTGCRTFGEIQAGAPGIPRSVLSQRLRLLEHYDVLERRAAGHRSTYHLTDCGRDLAEVCRALGVWGKRWLEIVPEHPDPRLTLWFWSRTLDRDRLPDRRVVIRFDLTDGSRPDRYWALVTREEPEICVKPPGFEEDLVLITDTDWLVRWYGGEVSLDAARRAGGIRIEGPPALVRGFARWSRQSPYADVESRRPAPRDAERPRPAPQPS